MGKNIIIAEDSNTWRRQYVRSIKRNFPDTHIDEVTTGSELVEKVLAGDYALILTDNDMNDNISGVDAIKQIRQSGNKTPIYMITGGKPQTFTDALKYGAEKVYDKAEFDMDAVLSDITKHLE